MFKIGHRGAAGHEPENTLRSFKKALEMGVDMVEFDVHLCKSGEVVVIHDETVNRTTNGTGLVTDKTLDELKRLDAGKGEKIPALEEVLDLINRKVAVNIELKGKGTAKPVARVVKTYIEKGWSPEAFLVGSFDRREFRHFIKVNPGVRLGILARKNPWGVITRAVFYGAYSVHIPKPYLKGWWIRRAQRYGFKVFIFTLNTPQEIKRARLLGVDGIFSDYPDRI